jgi:hypothetical protein
MPRAAGAFAAVAQRLIQVFASRGERRDQSKNEGCQHRYGQGEKQDWQVQANH